MTRDQLRAITKHAFRLECDRSQRIRIIRAQIEAAFKAGDDRMAYWQFPSPELVAYLKGIGEAYR